METCLETKQLLRWLNGSLDESMNAEVDIHIETCVECQQRLEELTNERSVSPPNDPGNLFDQSTFTNEPHFRSLREKLGESVADLLKDTTEEDNDPDLDQLKNVVVAPDASEQPTFEANLDSTLTLDRRTTVEDDEQDFAEHIEIEGYRLEKMIGQGGFAKVFQGWESKLERNVAIKILDQSRLNARNRHRFMREAKAASGIESPHVVKVLTVGETKQARPFIVMEMVEGTSLSTWIVEQTKHYQFGSNSIKAAVDLMIQVCHGTQAVHDAGLVHRDIKPGNIFIDSVRQVAKLGDFGLARILNEDTVTLTRAAELAGTPAYMSPEQTRPNSEIDSRSDVYALGATLYHCLSGQAPFSGSSLAILKQINEVQPLTPRLLNESVTRDLETICLKALDKTPGRRYQTADELADDLSRFASGQPILARPISRWEKTARWAKSNIALASTLSLLFLSLLIGSIVSTSLWLRSEQNASIANTRAGSLEVSQKSLNNTQMQLIDSVKNLVANALSRRSIYLQMSSADRQHATQSMVEAYSAIFDAVDNEPELIRELAHGMASAAEVNLDLRSQYWQTLEIVETNQQFVDRLMELPSPTLADRAVAAWVYNQRGDCLSNLEGKMANMKAGSAGWKTKTEQTAEAKVAFEKALSLSEFDNESPPDLVLQHCKASMNLVSQEDAGQDPTEETTAKMLSLLEEIKTVRNDEQFSPEWFGLHQRLLLRLSRRTKGQQSIDYRIARRDVMHEFVDRLTEAGQETFWYDRNVAVNDFFLGIAILRGGNVADATTSINTAVDRFKGLVEAFPQNMQFRADLAEAHMILADIAWHGKEEDQALESYDAALVQFEANLKIDWEQIGFRRRVSHVYELVGKRYESAGHSEKAQDCFDSAMRHIQAVIATKAEPAFEQSDREYLERLQSNSSH